MGVSDQGLEDTEKSFSLETEWGEHPLTVNGQLDVLRSFPNLLEMFGLPLVWPLACLAFSSLTSALFLFKFYSEVRHRRFEL